MKEKVKANLVLEIENRIEPILEIEEFKLVDIDIAGGKSMHITIYVYHKDKSNLEELGNINRILYPIIERIPQLNDGFLLEVSSPGIFRKFKYIKEFNIFKNKAIKIVTEEGKEFIGSSLGIKNNCVEMIIDGELKTFTIEKINSAKLNG